MLSDLPDAQLPAFDLSPEELTGHDRVALAVSGGGDSMAMLALYLRRRTRDGWPAPLVLTVDHGLRAGFEAEAAHVRRFCAANRLEWRLLRWTGEKPPTALMAQARQARYRLLADAAATEDASLILTAHTQDDVIETAAMRQARLVAGAAQAKPETAMERVSILLGRFTLVRPLLRVSRQALRAHLATLGIPFADDPSNDDPRFERVRVRTALRRGQRLGTLDDARLDRADLARRAAEWLADSVSGTGESIRLRPAQGHGADAAAFALRYVAAALDGSPWPATQAQGEHLRALLEAAPNGAGYAVCRLRFAKAGGAVRFARDPRHATLPFGFGAVSPFSFLCAESLLPLARQLATVLDAPPPVPPFTTPAGSGRRDHLDGECAISAIGFHESRAYLPDITLD
ncbi:MAG: tRNA lysidine(34) synthetase TilS [Rhizobiaceae bacterium]|jgi:tRNA(Ile)-lysidine synthetase-like protein|nr:tRNA lysidine(34) synthetase TilS [Rhizobiaceae bacterium]